MKLPLSAPKQTPKAPLRNTVFSTVAAVITTIAIQQATQPLTINQIYRQTIPSITTVTSFTLENDTFSPRSLIQTPTGTGTGFTYKEPNFIITNAHVVEGAFSIKVDDEDVEIVGTDTKHDIAVLKTKTSKPPLTKCSNPPKIGQQILVIGNPFGFEKSITKGIVSGNKRTLQSNQPLLNLIQVDAAINPGNSGGPLLDAQTGCVLGVNTAIVSPNGSSSGLGFSVPITTVDDVIDSILNKTTSQTAQLGVTILPDSYADGLGLKGAIISDVMPNTIAAKIGLKGTYRDEYGRPFIGDIIVGINDTPIEKKIELTEMLAEFKKGTTIYLHVLKQQGIETYEIVL
jgi:S1-C subfamily serine protease